MEGPVIENMNNSSDFTYWTKPLGFWKRNQLITSW